MARPVFIGSEYEATGYRLTGIAIVVPRDRDLSALFRTARAEASLIMLSATVAESLPRQVLEDAILRARPPVAVLPEAVGGVAPPDMEREVRAALGVL